MGIGTLKIEKNTQKMGKKNQKKIKNKWGEIGKSSEAVLTPLLLPAQERGAAAGCRGTAPAAPLALLTLLFRRTRPAGGEGPGPLPDHPSLGLPLAAVTGKGGGAERDLRPVGGRLGHT